jgi:hypothetical protein
MDMGRPVCINVRNVMCGTRISTAYWLRVRHFDPVRTRVDPQTRDSGRRVPGGLIPLHSSTMRPLSRLDDERKSGAIWYAIFRQSPKPPYHERVRNERMN